MTTDLDPEEVRHVYEDEGLSLNGTAKRFHVGGKRIREILVANGIPLKKQGGNRINHPKPLHSGQPKPNMQRRVSVQFIADTVKWWFDVRDLHAHTDQAAIARHVCIALAWKFLPDCTEWQMRQLFCPGWVTNGKKYVNGSANHVTKWADSPFKRHGLKQLIDMVQLVAQREGTRWEPVTDPIH